MPAARDPAGSWPAPARPARLRTLQAHEPGVLVDYNTGAPAHPSTRTVTVTQHLLPGGHMGGGL